MICNINEIDKIVHKLDEVIHSRDCVVLLQGDLASGKTTLVKHFVKFKNIDTAVTSPTFSLQAIYDSKIFHYDVYNKSLGEFLSLGMFEEFEKKGIHFVEWGEENLQKLLVDFGFLVFVLRIKKIDNKREYLIEQVNS
jgi:tRNA threonylcarbamoyladenosine biosynthesis protein TsaE